MPGYMPSASRSFFSCSQVCMDTPPHRFDDFPSYYSSSDVESQEQMPNPTEYFAIPIAKRQEIWYNTD